MANTTCAKCGRTQFELKEIELKNSRFHFMSVQCVSCGTPIGILDYMNIGDMLEKQNSAIRKIAEHLGISVGL